MNRVLIFLPGIMGSCLRVAGGDNLWYEDYGDSLSQIVKNPGLIKFNPHSSLEAYDIVAHGKIWLFPKKEIYGSFRQFLQKLPGYQYADFPYDWREDICHTSRKFGVWLARFGFQVDENDRQREESEPRLNIIGHSMGGLVASLALLYGHVHPGNVERLITIGTPFFGSPASFKSLFSTGYLSGMNLMERALNLRWNRRKSRQALLEAMQSFTSIYELMPPVTERFVDLPGGQTINPLDHNVGNNAAKQAAMAVHLDLDQLPHLFKAHPRLKHFFIYGDDSENTDRLYSASIANSGLSYEAIDCFRQTDGDGTVSVRSASVCTSPLNRTPVVGAEHAFMCADPRVQGLVAAYLT